MLQTQEDEQDSPQLESKKAKVPAATNAAEVQTLMTSNGHEEQHESHKLRRQTNNSTTRIASIAAVAWPTQ